MNKTDPYTGDLVKNRKINNKKIINLFYVLKLRIVNNTLIFYLIH